MTNQKSLGTVLVIGGNGFLGWHIVQRLLAGNHADKVVSASRTLPRGSVPTDSRLSHHTVDITSTSSVDALFSAVKPDVVIHTVSPPPRSHASILEATNVVGTNNLLDSAQSCPQTKAFIFTSSDSACHPSPVHQITEKQCKLYTSTDFPNHYARTKAIADAAVLSADCPGMRTITLRLPSIYGEGDRNFIPQIVNSLLSGQWKTQIGPNDKIFEFVYVHSAAQAHILAAQALLSDTVSAGGQAFFITDGIAMPFFDFMRRCYAATGSPISKDEVTVIPFWVVQLMASIGEWLFWIFTFGKIVPKMRREDIDHLGTGCHWNIEKARRVLGYEPVVEQTEAIRDSMDWGMKSCVVGL